MSRIILSRHDNGEEHITLGWDRPMQHYFWSVCDEDGESIDESYMDRGLEPTTTQDLVNFAATHNDTVFRMILEVIEWSMSKQTELLVELKRHQTLDYPESNIIIDMSEDK